MVAKESFAGLVAPTEGEKCARIPLSSPGSTAVAFNLASFAVDSAAIVYHSHLIEILRQTRAAELT